MQEIDREHANIIFKKMANYVAIQCYGCSDTPRILEIKSYKVMMEAYNEGLDPINKLNEFLGTNVPRDVLFHL